MMLPRRVVPLLVWCALSVLGAPAVAGAQDTGTVPVTSTPAAATTAPAPAATTPATAAPPAGAPTTTPSAEARSPDHATVVLLVLVGAVLLCAGLAIAAARWWAYEPDWIVRARHATAEAGWRTSAAWAEFRDWVRLGR
jgi:hypothetical protein